MRKSHSKEKSVGLQGSKAHSEDPGLSLTKLAKTLGVSDTTMRRIAEEDLRFKSCDKSSTNALRALKLSGNMEMFWSKEFWLPNSPDLNPMDYYVWSVIERVTNKSRSQHDISSGRY